jgi:hypothetical protein
MLLRVCDVSVAAALVLLVMCARQHMQKAKAAE